MASIEEERLVKLKTEGHPTAKWGPYLSERQWGTVREDYSPDGMAWKYFPHEHARSRAYRWGEDGLAGISDNQCQLCFALALWNGQDPILKERLFGLSNQEGNHGEDVKELYYYLDNTPTHSYMQYLYKYPQQAFPYSRLVDENAARSQNEEEFELIDTGVFNDGNYFDVTITYAKKDEEDICIKIEIKNYSKEAKELTLLPTLWFRNQWTFNLIEGKPGIELQPDNGNRVHAYHPSIGDYYLYFDKAEQLLFTENETNTEKLYLSSNNNPFVKDAFHKAVINQDYSIFKEKKQGTKFSPLYKLSIQPGATTVLQLRLTKEKSSFAPFGKEFDDVFTERKKEADEFYAGILPNNLDADSAGIARKAYAGMLWNKQYYYYDVLDWLQGDKGQPTPPQERWEGRNRLWKHLNNRDIISMPDKWEYPWYAAWDLAFHTIILANIDSEFAKQQQILITREWYTHPDGKIPAYEWGFSDVNPPVQAWAAMRVYEIDKKRTGISDVGFLKRIFQKLSINFTWWANRKDREGNFIFEGGFLGLDNIGVLDRERLPEGYTLEQADGTAWMGMFASSMLQMALEITQYDDTFEDVATKYFEHYIFIAEAFNIRGLWDENEHFFYDVLMSPTGFAMPVKVRSLVGMTSLFTAFVVSDEMLVKLKNFKRGIQWFRNYRQHRGEYLAMMQWNAAGDGDKLITLIYQDKLEALLKALLDEQEFLSPYGIRSVSKKHEKAYEVTIAGQTFSLKYEPGESTNRIFGGNSNWRGPIWFPMNYLIIESLRAYYNYFKDTLKVELPTGSNHYLNLKEVADELNTRLLKIYKPDSNGNRAAYGRFKDFYLRPENKDLLLFHEYFHGETGMGLGASHQTGWTGLLATLLQEKQP